MNNVTYNLNSLTKDDVSTILETLLFSSSVDVVANWYKENSEQMFDIAKKIRKNYPDVLLENVYLYENKEVEYNDEHTKEITKMFPEIRKEKIELV
jgi:ATP-dependent phosphoenolpyruvate carboxykinase